MASERPSTLLLWMTIVAAPGALAIETGLRLLFFPPDFDLVREFLRPTLTPVAWAFAGLAGLGAVLGVVLQEGLVKRRLEKLDGPANTLQRRFRAAFGVFLLTTAVPQIPSVIATVCFTLGASLIPVALAITLTTFGVFAQALRVPKLAA